MKKKCIYLILFFMFFLTGCHSHSYLEVVVKPTCYEIGYTAYRCLCGNSYKDNYVDMLGHSYGEWTIISYPTEETNGLKTAKCLSCGYETAEEMTYKDHEHEYNTKVYSPTCVNEGYTEYICVCGDVKKDNYVPALGHTAVVDERVEPTCFSEGKTEGKHCSRCQEVLLAQDSIAKIEHFIVDNRTIAPTCLTNGYTGGTHCFWCDTNFKEGTVLNATGHSYGNWVVIKAATEEATGSKKKTCTKCSNIVTEVIPMLSHTHKYTTSTVGATCTEQGYTLHTCKCGYSYKDSYVSKLPHKEVTISGYASTCSTNGYTNGKKCTVCNTVTVQQVKLPLSSHSLGDFIITIEPTTTSTGQKCRVCKICNTQTEITEIPKSPSHVLTFKLLDSKNEYEVSGYISSFISSSGKVTIPETYNGFPVIGIGENALANCTKLVNLVIPDTIEYIGDAAFSGCKALTIINLPNGLTKIGSSLFKNCSALPAIAIPSSVKEIGPSAFLGCYTLKDIEIPSGVTKIEDQTFQQCLGLMTIKLPSGISSLGNSSFQGCTALNITELPSSLSTIGEYCFDGCTSITTLILGSKVTTIGSYAFRNCSKFEMIIIPKAVTKIGEKAFQNNSKLSIMCEAKSKPSGWNSRWNYSNCSVYWGI